ncbi:hypothetical protein NL108_006329 [Boleophthalmus pectinirostris]|nr:hypothetical protein NL108_006329 [Boleophthalmus pectinirostris]
MYSSHLLCTKYLPHKLPPPASRGQMLNFVTLYSSQCWDRTRGHDAPPTVHMRSVLERGCAHFYTHFKDLWLQWIYVFSYGSQFASRQTEESQGQKNKTVKYKLFSNFVYLFCLGIKRNGLILVKLSVFSK